MCAIFKQYLQKHFKSTFDFHLINAYSNACIS